MAEGDLLMSGSERDRAHVVREALEHRLGQREASERLGIGVRQFKRLVRSWREEGDAGLISRQRGRASHNQLAAEKLLEVDGIEVSRETIRQLQVGLGLWKPKSRRVRRVFQLRERRPRFGELIQIDGSPHDWFEGRALRFARVESARAYLEALRDHVLEHGCPLAFYSDRHGIFRVNAKDARSGDGKTEFGRVAARLDIVPIHALTPQAKGRMERANQTLQDRLVKEMRLQNISSIGVANGFFPKFIAAWNVRFALKPRNETSAHRPWTETPEALDHALARHEDRVLSKALTFSSAGTKYCVNAKGPGTTLRGAKVTLHHFVGGGMTVHYKDRVLPVTAYGTYAVPDPAEDEKTIDARVNAIVASRGATDARLQPQL
jgi:transposase